MNSSDVRRQFNDVDHSADPTDLINYLNATNNTDWFRTVKRRSFDLMAIQEGHHVLDVGCGTGEDVRALSELVGPGGRAVGIDNSTSMIAEASKRSANTQLPTEFLIQDAYHITFDDNSFDACRAERTLVHLEQPHIVLSEMIRVVRPGGRVVVFEGDWETLVIAADNRPLTRKILNSFCDSARNGWIGRYLAPLLGQLGLTQLTVIPETFLMTDYGQFDQLIRFRPFVEQLQAAGEIAPSEASEYLTKLEAQSQTGAFFAAITCFLVAGCKLS